MSLSERLLTAVKSSNVNTLQRLCKQGANVNCQYDFKQTLLMIAAHLGNLDIIKCLVDNKADVNKVNIDRETAVMIAARNGAIDVVKYLCENSADVNIKDNYAHTALMLAATHGRIDVVQYLCTCGADANSKDEDGNTALTYAIMYNHLEVVKYLSYLPEVHIDDHVLDELCPNKEIQDVLTRALRWKTSKPFLLFLHQSQFVPSNNFQLEDNSDGNNRCAIEVGNQSIQKQSAVYELLSNGYITKIIYSYGK